MGAQAFAQGSGPQSGVGTGGRRAEAGRTGGTRRAAPGPVRVRATACLRRSNVLVC